MLIALGILFVGYSMIWFGYMRVGGPIDIGDLMLPGRPEPKRGGGSQ